jgi:DNA-binding NarL/FixJ family response regulator
MPGINGIECVRTLKPLKPKVNYMMLTAYHDAQLIFDALSAGASGYLLKRSSREELIAAITYAHNGGNPMSSHITQTVVEALKTQPTKKDAIEQLTFRELEVLECMATGMRHKEIALHFGVSYNTIHTLIYRIYEKLEVHTSKEAIAKLKKP